MPIQFHVIYSNDRHDYNITIYYYIIEFYYIYLILSSLSSLLWTQLSIYMYRVSQFGVPVDLGIDLEKKKDQNQIDKKAGILS